MKKRGLYSRDLTKSVKVRVDEDTFSQLHRLSEEKNVSLSLVLREIISNSLPSSRSVDI